jgi:predicted MFS family arabinose efflux permease
MLVLTLLMFFQTFAYSLMQGMFALYSEQLFGWGQKETGYFFGIMGVASVITQGFLMRKLINYYSDANLIKFSLPFTALSFLIFVYFPHPSAFYFNAVLIALFSGIFGTALQGEISKESTQDEQGVVLGTIQGFGALARALGPVAGGLLFTGISPQSPFTISGLILVALSLLTFTQNFKKPAVTAVSQ